MIVEPIYRIDRNASTKPEGFGVVTFEVGSDYRHVGVLVLDTRLQTIADAYEDYLMACDDGMPLSVEACKRFLFDKLDVLIKENNLGEPSS